METESWTAKHKMKKKNHCMKRLNKWDLLLLSNFVPSLLVISRNAFRVRGPRVPSSFNNCKTSVPRLISTITLEDVLHLKYDLYLLLSLPGWQEWKWKDKSNKNQVYVCNWASSKHGSTACSNSQRLKRLPVRFSPQHPLPPNSLGGCTYAALQHSPTCGNRKSSSHNRSYAGGVNRKLKSCLVLIHKGLILIVRSISLQSS